LGHPVDLTYVSFVVAEVDAEHGHSTDDGDKRLDGVTVDDRLELLVVFAGETAFVDDSVPVTNASSISDESQSIRCVISVNSILF